MRYIFILFFILIGSLPHLLHAEPATETMDHAEGIMTQQPDSALSALQTLLPQHKRLNASDKARFGLLFFIALDKCRHPLQPIEWIEYSADYYRKGRQNEALAYALLYLSRSHWQNQDGQAAILLVEALRHAPNNNHDLLGKLYSDMASIYKKREEYTQARRHYEVALQHFNQTDHINNQAATICNIGTMFYLTEQYDSASVHYHHALQVATDSMRIGHILKSLADNHHSINQYDSALHYIRASLHYPAWSQSYPFRMVTLADIFFDTQQYDSAHHYAEKLLTTYPDNVYVQKNAYRLLSNIAFTKRELNLVPIYTQLLQQCDMQIKNIKQSIPSPAAAQDLLEARDISARERKSIVISWALLLIALLTAGGLGWYQLHKHHQKKLDKLKTQEKNKKEQALVHQKRETELQLRRNELCRRMEFQRQKLALLHKGRPVPPEDLKSLYNSLLFIDSPDKHARLIHTLFGNLDERLLPYSLTPPRLLYIHLLLLGVSKSDICVVLDYKKGSIEQIRRRLAQKFELGSALKLDAFLQSLAGVISQEESASSSRS